MKNQTQMQTKPSRDVIARRAYEIWKTTGCPAGRDVEHWLQAEQELRAGPQNTPKFAGSRGPARSDAPVKPAPQPAIFDGWKAKSRVIEGLRRAQRIPK